MIQVNPKNQRARPPPNKVVALFLYPKLTMKRGKEDGMKFVVPDMAETFGKLSYAGEGEILTEGYGREYYGDWSQLPSILRQTTGR